MSLFACRKEKKGGVLMQALVRGRVLSCREKKSQKGTKYFLVNMVQGEGTDRVDVLYIYSNEKVELGEQEINANVYVRDGRMQISSFE